MFRQAIRIKQANDSLAPSFRRSASTKRSAKKMNAKYAVQNVQASFGYLFNSVANTAAVAEALERSTQGRQGSAGNPVFIARGNNKSDPEHLYDTPKRFDEPIGSKTPSKGIDRAAEVERSNGKNQQATVSYLFANGKPISNFGVNVGPDPVNPRRRSNKRKESPLERDEHVGNDALHRQNVAKSMKYLFGVQIAI